MIEYVGYGAALKALPKFILYTIVIMMIGLSVGYFTRVISLSYDVEAELKYWRSNYPKEHQRAKQNGFKIGTNVVREEELIQ